MQLQHQAALRSAQAQLQAAFAALQPWALRWSGAGLLLKQPKRQWACREPGERTPAQGFIPRKGEVNLKWSCISELFMLTFETALILPVQKGRFCSNEQLYQKLYFNSSAENTAGL